MWTKAIERMVMAGAVLSAWLIAVIFLREYLSQQVFNLALAVLAIPFVLQIAPNTKGSYRFAIPALLFAALSFRMPVSTWVYLSIISVSLLVVEIYWGRVNFLTILLVLLSLPFTAYIADTFSFPIRIWLTAVCGHIFHSTRIPVEVTGNTFLYEDADFTVDPVCMGLNMLITSFLAGLLLLGFYQKKYRKGMSYPLLALYLLAIFGLNILSNLVRLMTLVLFRIYPETLGHEMVGILCFLLQVILPAWGICLFLIRFFPAAKRKRLSSGGRSQQSVKGRLVLIAVCSGLLWGAALYVDLHKKENGADALLYNIPGYTTEACPFGVSKLENGSSLIYIKPIRWFCDSEHNPMLCWRGSGYQLSHVEERVWNGLPLYTAILQNGNDILYTAWWYDNGQTATISQFHWRRDMLLGAPAYALLNVTTVSESSLKEEVEKIKRGLTSLFIVPPAR